MNGRIGRLPDTVLAMAVAGIIALLVFPVPPAMLDVLLPAQLGASAAVLVAALGARGPSDLSALPSVLLLATLLRLGLNVSTTRLVLARGDAGSVVAAFGDAVVAGNPLAGAVVFAVLTIAQYLVIARGAERVAQVGARFALDGLPGRQLAIDADVRSGLLDPEAARSRRASLASDSSFYGAMDGAMKFVRGEAVAGLCIVAVNLAGGLAVGVAQRGLSVEDAARTYLVLTVGDGLLTQIPALLNAIAAGLVVTRVADPDAPALGSLLARQLGGRGRALLTAGGLLAALGLLPGLPALAFVPVGGALALGGIWRARRSEREAPPVAADPAPLGLRVHPDALKALGPVPPEEVVERARSRLQREYGFDVPSPAVTLSAAELPPAGWRVEVGEAPVARGVLVPNIGPGLPPDERLALDCAAAWRRHAGPLLGVQIVSDRLSRLESTHPALLRAVVPRRIDVPRLARLLQRLLAEDVPIRDLVAVLEALAADVPEAEQYRVVRRAMGRVITHRLAPDGRADVVMCAAAFEEALRRDAGPAPDHVEDVVAAVRAARARQPRAAVLVAPDVRERAFALVGAALPDVPIVSAEELLPGTKVTPVAVVGD